MNASGRLTVVAEGSERVANVLVVEDEKAVRLTLCDILHHAGFAVRGCKNATQALESARSGDFAVAIVDLRLPDLEGIQVLKRLRQHDETIQVIIHTAFGSFDSARDAVNLGAFAYLEKPGDHRELVRLVHRGFQVRMQRALEKSEKRYRDMEELERLKTEFISVVNHELRTPLTSIRGALRLLMGGVFDPSPDKTRELLEVASRNSDRLAKIIDDILDLSKIEAGRMEFEIAACDLGPLLEQAVDTNQPYAEQLDVRLVLVPHGGGAVAVDKERFAQVLSNLISNAVKHSPSRGSVELAAARGSAGSWRISVTDQGPGIPEERRPQVFEKFARINADSSRGARGTGLGLSICKAMVEQMGGTIGFTSQVDVETTFYCDLPEVREPGD